MSKQGTISFHGQELPTFTERGFISILDTFCEPFKDRSLTSIDTIEGTTVTSLSDGLELPFLQGFLKPYAADKCEKLCITNCILMDRILVSALIILPHDDYDLPILVLEWSETEDVISLLVDLVPLADPVTTPWYRETYLDGLDEYWTKCVELPWMKQNRFAWVRTTFSAYYLSGAASKKEEQNRKDCVDIVSTYLNRWLGCMEKAEPVTDPAYKKALAARKQMLRKIFRANDEGAKTMRQMVGPEVIEKLLLCNF